MKITKNKEDCCQEIDLSSLGFNANNQVPYSLNFKPRE
jgi:hypothetical protein